jgi:penicillin-binding protein 2
MFAALRAMVLLLFGILVIQLINLQILRSDDLAEKARINALRELPEPASRGLIYDRNGRLLVQNSARFSAAIIPGELPERGAEAVFRDLERVLGVPVGEIERTVQEGILAQGEFSPALIKDDLSRETALILMELAPHAPGLMVLAEPSREYMTGSLLSHVLGYVGPISPEEYASLGEEGYLFQDFIGKTGIEITYETLLRGQMGKKFVEVDAMGRELNVISERPQVDGSNLVLTIDLELQRQVADALAQFSEGSDNASAVVMDVNTGEVLAMMSLPTYDNNLFSGPLSEDDLAQLMESPGKPLVNHAIAERYAPGSTFKTIVGAAALQEGVATTGTLITSRGYITVENEFDPNVVYRYDDWAPLGTLDFYDGLAMSSNVYFYYLAGGKPDEGFRGLGVEKVASYARAFGLGEPTGIDLPSESAGVVPDSQWKEETVGEPWTLGDTYNLGIGQGYVSVTPLQMVTAISAIANGGDVLTPRLLKEVQDSRGNVLETTEPEVRDRVPVDPDRLDIMARAMRQSVTDGVATAAAVAGVSVAGKTGTAQFGEQDDTEATHGWFVGFAPYEDPEIAIVVFIQKGGGGQNAAPAAANILDGYFHGPRLTRTLEEEGD